MLGFRGVVWDKGWCGGSKCLLTICGNTTAKFVQSSLKDVNATDSLKGIVCISDHSDVRFEQSIFASNTAVNGTLHVGDAAKVALVDSKVIGNMAFGGNFWVANDVYQPWNGKGAGASLHVRGFAQVTLSGTAVSSNMASRRGGGLYTEGNARVIMSNSTVYNNSALEDGGGLYAKDLAIVVVANYSTFSNNLAGGYGGGVSANGYASIMVANSSAFSNNHANGGGGGAVAWGNASITVANSSSFSSNSADWGGGSHAWANASITVANSNTFINNSAGQNGGGAYAGHNASITVANSSTFNNNSAGQDGGGASASGNASITVANRSTFSNNSAGRKGGGVDVWGSASITVTNSSTFNNNSAKYGGGAAAGGNASIMVANSSTFSSNNARNPGAEGGGGVYAGGNATITVANSSTFSNNRAGWAGGGAYAFDCASITVIHSSTFRNNTSRVYGGGAFARDYASIMITNSSTFSNNRVSQFGGGANAGGNASITVANSSTFSNNTAQNAGGLSCQENSTCQVLDSYICHHAVAGVGAGLSIGDNVTALISNSTLMFNRAVQGGAIHASSPIRHYPSNFTLRIGNKSHIAHCTAANGGGIYLEGGVTIIGPGVRIEGNNASTGGGVFIKTAFCNSCTANLSISPAAHIRNNTADLGGGIYKDSALSAINDADARQAATDNTAFFGADLVTSQCIMGEVFKGKWCERCGSNLYSLSTNNTRCDICPAHANCTGGDVILPEKGYWHSSKHSTQIHRCPNANACSQREDLDNTTIDWQCAQGHSGNLCGKCVSKDTTKFGFTGAFRCRQCLGRETMIALLVVSVLLMLLLNVFTAHYTYKDNLEVVDKSDVWPSDVIKVLVLYLQYLIIISSAPLDWPRSLTAVFFAVSWVFAAGTSQAVSLDCIYSASGLPLAIKRLLTYLIGPFVIAGAVIIVYCLILLGRKALERCLMMSRGRLFTSQSLWGYVSNRVPAILLVVLYAFFYPHLVKVGWSMFACYHIDDPNDHNKGLYRQYLQANGSYWVYDIQEPCWSKHQGYHFIWALSLGIPTLLLFCIAVPVAIICCMRANKSMLGQLSFRTHFGFLYRNYTERCCWWEGIIATQTVLLVAISVFSSILGVYYELLLFCATFAVIIIVHQLCVPMRVKKLYFLQLAAYVCLLTVCFVSLSFLTLDAGASSPDAYREIAGALLLVQNIAFSGWAVYHLVMALKGPVARFICAVKQHPWWLKVQAKWVEGVGYFDKVLFGVARSDLPVTRPPPEVELEEDA
eukprot:jgi/Chrzof1/6167/Cz17g14020.t1